MEQMNEFKKDENFHGLYPQGLQIHQGVQECFPYLLQLKKPGYEENIIY
jgi:hypothetical protein